MVDPPQIVVIAGPNGAGKTTCASRYIPEGMVYVNADQVAKGLSDYPSASADIQAGRIALETMTALGEEGQSFAVETTLATRSLAVRIIRLRQSGYHFHLNFLWSPNPDFSVARVAARVRAGGHHIPEATIRRRFAAGLDNFFRLYQPIADVWEVLDSTGLDGPRWIASGRAGQDAVIFDGDRWDSIRQGRNDEPE